MRTRSKAHQICRTQNLSFLQAWAVNCTITELSAPHCTSIEGAYGLHWMAYAVGGQGSCRDAGRGSAIGFWAYAVIVCAGLSSWGMLAQT